MHARRLPAFNMKRQSSEPETILYPSVETHLLVSRHVDQTFKVQVMLPPHRQGELLRMPVLYMTDGNSMFEAVRAASYGVQGRFILVGIGYPSDMPFAGAWLRARDLSFPGYPHLGLQPPDIEGVLLAPEGGATFYGSEQFLQFLAEELFPFVDKTYPTKSSPRGYFGHSLGAGFGLHCLLTRPALFNRYILSSPGLSYHGTTSGGRVYDNYDFAIGMIRDCAARAPRLMDAKLFMSAGSDEEFEPGLEAWRLTSSLYRTAAVLRDVAIPGLEVQTEVFPRETHGTVWLSSITRGIRAVFAEDEVLVPRAATFDE